MALHTGNVQSFACACQFHIYYSPSEDQSHQCSCLLDAVSIALCEFIFEPDVDVLAIRVDSYPKTKSNVEFLKCFSTYTQL